MSVTMTITDARAPGPPRRGADRRGALAVDLRPRRRGHALLLHRWRPGTPSWSSGRRTAGLVARGIVDRRGCARRRAGAAVAARGRDDPGDPAADRDDAGGRGPHDARQAGLLVRPRRRGPGRARGGERRRTAPVRPRLHPRPARLLVDAALHPDAADGAATRSPSTPCPTTTPRPSCWRCSAAPMCAPTSWSSTAE